LPEILQDSPLIGCAVGQSYVPPAPVVVVVRPPVDVVVGITDDVVPPVFKVLEVMPPA
jgi:hypothetical protein